VFETVGGHGVAFGIAEFQLNAIVALLNEKRFGGEPSPFHFAFQAAYVYKFGFQAALIAHAISVFRLHPIFRLHPFRLHPIFRQHPFRLPWRFML